MGTPLKPLRLISPKLISPSLRVTNNSVISRKNSISKRLDYDQPKTASKLALPKQNLIINTPTKKQITENGLRSWSNLNVLGRGAFGTVVRGIYKGEHAAVKIVKTHCKISESNALNLEHKNLICYKDVYKAGLHAIVIMEYLEDSKQMQTLLDDENYTFDLARITRFAGNIAAGLAYCHSNELLHLDLKPANVLITRNGIAKICDFGNSYLLSDTNTYKFQGTVAYAAPELLLGEIPTKSCDVYSFGILLWQLIHRNTPYHDLNNNEIVIYKVVKFDLRPSIEKQSDDFEHLSVLYQQCWLKDANLRPTFLSVIHSLEN